MVCSRLHSHPSTSCVEGECPRTRMWLIVYRHWTLSSKLDAFFFPFPTGHQYTQCHHVLLLSVWLRVQARLYAPKFQTRVRRILAREGFSDGRAVITLCLSVAWQGAERRQEERKTKNTHQLNERQPSVAVGHDEDILGLRSGHKVVPHVENMLLGGCIVLQDMQKPAER